MCELIRTERHPDYRYTAATECAYCETLIPSKSSHCVVRVSYGWANNALLPFCSRVCRGFYRECSPEWSDRDDDQDRDVHPSPNRTLSEFCPDPARLGNSNSPVATTSGP